MIDATASVSTATATATSSNISYNVKFCADGALFSLLVNSQTGDLVNFNGGDVESYKMPFNICDFFYVEPTSQPQQQSNQTCMV